jgi:sterol desaturase/sphingolipid hydroxylase (fatty acid hydroxylase superfamily)
MPTFYIVITATLAFNGLLMATLIWAFHHPRMVPHRHGEYRPMKIPASQRNKVVGFSLVLSLTSTLGLIYLIHRYVLVTDATPWWMKVVQGLAVLVVYDTAYWAMHRLMHVKKLMRFVHGVHHRARFPTALESLYLSPIELIAGLALMAVSVWGVGLVTPIHEHAFLGIFFVYSTMNVVVHAGFSIPHPLFAPFNYMVRKHHIHHHDEFGKNYASLTPLPDMLFGTTS